MQDTVSMTDLAARLKSAMGDPNFDHVCAEVKALPREAVLVVAQHVLGLTLAPSTGKKQALALVRGRHEGKLATRLGLRSQGGRSAA